MPKYGKELQKIVQDKMMAILPNVVEKSSTVQHKTLAVVNEIHNIIEEITNPEVSPEGNSEIPKSRKERAEYFRKLRTLTQSVKNIGKTARKISTVLHSKSRIVKGSQTVRLLLTVSYSGNTADSNDNAHEKKKLIVLSREAMLNGKNLQRIKETWDRTD